MQAPRYRGLRFCIFPGAWLSIAAHYCCRIRWYNAASFLLAQQPTFAYISSRPDASTLPTQPHLSSTLASAVSKPLQRHLQVHTGTTSKTSARLTATHFAPMSVHNKNFEFDNTILSDLTSFVKVDPSALSNIIFGGCSDIYPATLSSNGSTRLAAVKIPRIHGQKDPQAFISAFLREAVLWSKISHPHIAPCLGVTFHGQNANLPTLGMDWYENGSLAQFLFKHPEMKKLPFIIQVGSALQYLHSLDIVHGDIKAENVLVTSGNPPKALLADFGLSRLVDGTQGFTTSSVRGTLHFMAPELLQHLVYEQRRYNRQCTKESDVWAFGMFIIQVYSSRLPLSPPQCKTEAQLAQLIVLEKYRPTREDTPRVPEEIWQSGVLSNCWEDNPVKRSKITEVLQILEGISASDM